MRRACSVAARGKGGVQTTKVEVRGVMFHCCKGKTGSENKQSKIEVFQLWQRQRKIDGGPNKEKQRHCSRRGGLSWQGERAIEEKTGKTPVL